MKQHVYLPRSGMNRIYNRFSPHLDRFSFLRLQTELRYFLIWKRESVSILPVASFSLIKGSTGVNISSSEFPTLKNNSTYILHIFTEKEYEEFEKNSRKGIFRCFVRKKKKKKKKNRRMISEKCIIVWSPSFSQKKGHWQFFLPWKFTTDELQRL